MAYEEYFKGEPERARELFKSVSLVGKLLPGVKHVAVTDKTLVTQSGKGLLSLDRADGKPLRWRAFRAVSPPGALRKSDGIAMVETPDGEEAGRLLVLDARTLETQFERPCHRTGSMATSPDGRWIAVLDPERKLVLIDASTLKDVVELIQPPAEHYVDIAMHIEFSPNGNYLIALSQEILTKASAPYRIELHELPHDQFFTGQNLEREFHDEVVGWPHWAFSPDSRFLALADNNKHDLELIDLEKNKTVAHTAKCKNATSLDFLSDGSLQAYDDKFCRFNVPKLTALPPTKPESSSRLQLSSDLAERLKQRFCSDARSVFPSDMRSCTTP